MIIGLAAVPIRSILFALTADPVLLVVIQLLDGLSGATLGVLTALIVADVTAGTGRFNLAQGLVGAASGVGATLSTSVAGIVVEKFGYTAGLLGVTAVGLLAVVIVVGIHAGDQTGCQTGRAGPGRKIRRRLALDLKALRAASPASSRARSRLCWLAGDSTKQMLPLCFFALDVSIASFPIRAGRDRDVACDQIAVKSQQRSRRRLLRVKVLLKR